MYNSYFGFLFSPFENNLDQQFLFLSEGHQEVIGALFYFVQEKKSFALVCGDVGTGKTMIVHHLLSKLPGSIKPILIPYSDVEYIEILRYIARVLKINPEGKGVLDLTDEIKTALIMAGLDGKQFVLIIDEAHLLSIRSLEYIRLLSNIETTEKKLLQILLLGQNELSHKLRRSEMRQFRQRINVNRFLSPMSASETIGYIDHRLRVAGCSFGRCFEPACKKMIYKMTGGVPRSINRLCDTALLVCMIEKGAKVTGRVLKKAHDALDGHAIPERKESRSGRFFNTKILKPALAGVGGIVFLLALGFLAYKGVQRLEPWIYGPHFPEAANTYVEKPLPPVPKVKSVVILKPQRAEEKSPSRNVPGPVTPQTLSPEQESPKVLHQEGEPVRDIEKNVIKTDTASLPIEVAGPNPAPPEETQVKDQIPDASREPARTQGGDAERGIAAMGGNPDAALQNLQIGGRALGSSDVFTGR